MTLSACGAPLPVHVRSGAFTLALVLAFAAPLPCVPAAFAATAEQKCAVAKLKAAAKLSSAKLACHQKALAKGVAVAAECLLKAELAFAKAFAKAEKKVPCAGTAGVLEAEADACVAGVVDAVPAPTLTPLLPSPTPTSTPVEPQSLAGITAAHNQVRAGVGVPPLVWSDALAASAQAWAETCTDSAAPIGLLDVNPDRSAGQPYYVGENVYASSGPVTAAAAVAQWAGEAANYDYAADTCASGQSCARYTQVVWAASLELGCGTASCPGLAFGNAIVCDYGPGGNTGGRPY